MNTVLVKTLIPLKEHKWYVLLFLLLFGLEIFLRFYQFELRNPFGWDQVDNAWAAKNILVDKKLLLVGMVAKGNSGVYIGPLYYYFVSVFYYFTHLDPIASGIIAGVSSAISSLLLFFLVKNLFSIKVAFIALFIQTVCFASITFDRVQWPVDFIPIISLLIFYALYKVLTGNIKYFLLLGIALGLSFHIHFTSIFDVLGVLVTLPFVPKRKSTLLYGGIGLCLFLLFLIPTIITTIQNSHYVGNAMSYGHSYFHGFHLRRVWQLIPDAFIQYIPYLTFSPLSILRYIFLPLFSLLYIYTHRTKASIILVALFWIWFVIPWFVLSTYGGEISDYYFSSTKFFALITIAYCIGLLITKKNIIVSILACLVLVAYGWFGINQFFPSQDKGILYEEQTVKSKIQHGEVIPFAEGVPDSYLYYIYKQLK